MKAIKINVETKTLDPIEISKDWREIPKQIGNGCDIFCVPIKFDNNDCLYADDESLLRMDDIKGGFSMEGWNYPIVGNALIIGTNDEGDSVDCVTEIEELSQKLFFINDVMAKEHAVKALSTPPQIHFFNS